MKQVHIEYVSVYVCVCIPGSYNCIRCIFTERVWLPRDTLRDFPHPVLGSNTSVFTSQDMEQLSHTPTNWPGITNAMTVHICLLPTDQTKQASCPCTSASPSSQMHFLKMEERKRDLYSFQETKLQKKKPEGSSIPVLSFHGSNLNCYRDTQEADHVFWPCNSEQPKSTKKFR